MDQCTGANRSRAIGVGSPLRESFFGPCRSLGLVLRCAPRVAAAGVADFPSGLRLDRPPPEDQVPRPGPPRSPHLWTLLWKEEIEASVTADELWDEGAAALRNQLAPATWAAWFHGVAPLSCDDETLVLSVPSSLAAERIRSSYSGMLTDAIRDRTGETVRIDLVVETTPRETSVVSHERPLPLVPAHDGPTTDDVRAATLTTLDTDEGGSWTSGTLNSRYTFDQFVIGASNRFAHAAALSVAESPGRSYNPLFIYGPAGLGKTHLLHAIGHHVRTVFRNKRVRYVSTESFMNEFVDAIRAKAMPSFKRRYRDLDVLLIDDIQFLERTQELQEEFFHTFNQLHGEGGQIVISSDRPPKSIASLEDRLRTRFEWGLITDVQPPEFETRLAILRKKAESEHLGGIPPEVLAFIATNISDNIRELEGALIRVAAYSSLNRAELSEEVARKVLADLLPPTTPRNITPDLILDETAKMFGWTVEDLCGKSRRRPLVTARQISMYVMRELTDLSYPRIAEAFGGRDHTTVMYAVDKIKQQMTERHQTFDQVNELITRIRLGGGG
jgi:chromosomal replication initiator protein